MTEKGRIQRFDFDSIHSMASALGARINSEEESTISDHILGIISIFPLFLHHKTKVYFLLKDEVKKKHHGFTLRLLRPGLSPFGVWIVADQQTHHGKQFSLTLFFVLYLLF